MLRFKRKYLDENNGEGSDLGGVDVVVDESLDGGVEQDYDEQLESGFDDILDDSEGVDDEVAASEDVQVDEEATEEAEPEKQDDLTDEQAKEFAEELRAEGKEKTASRFEALHGKLKESEAQIQQFQTTQQNYDTLTSELFDRGGMSPDGLGQYVNLCEDLKNGQIRPETMQYVQEMARQLSNNFGVDFANINPFEGFDDIQHQVDNLLITEEAGKELMRARQSQSQITASNEAQQRETNEESQFNERKESALDSLDARYKDLRVSDPDFAMKEKIIADQLKTQAEGKDPSEWLGMFELIYQTSSASISAASESSKRNRDTNTLGNGLNNGMTGKPDMNEDNYIDQYFGGLNG